MYKGEIFVFKDTARRFLFKYVYTTHYAVVYQTIRRTRTLQVILYDEIYMDKKHFFSQSCNIQLHSAVESCLYTYTLQIYINIITG